MKAFVERARRDRKCQNHHPFDNLAIKKGGVCITFYMTGKYGNSICLECAKKLVKQLEDGEVYGE